MNRRGIFALVGVFLVSALLAFPARGFVNQLVLVPISYLLWLLKLFYLSVDQALWWIGVVLVVLLILGTSLLPEFKQKRNLIEYKRQERGNVESLARAIQKSDRGIYFKWLVANRLGKLAHQMLTQREPGKPRSVFSPLQADGWNPTGEIQNYLEKGLHGTFADFPNTNWNYFLPPQKTQLDHDVNEVVEFLESKMENK